MVSSKQNESASPSFSDKRLTWLEQRISNNLRTRPVDLRKCLESDPVRLSVQDFFESASMRQLFVWAISGLGLNISCHPPDGKSKKVMYFIKKELVKITIDNIDTIIQVGDMAGSALETLSLMMEEVFFPHLLVGTNVPGVPPLIKADMLEKFRTLHSTMDVVIGQTKGKTLLPLPTFDTIKGSPPISRDKRVQALLNAVSGWSRQIKATLAQEPVKTLQQIKAHPGPLDELDFWETRVMDLEALEDQLQGPQITKVLKFLTAVESSSFSSFSILIGEVRKQAAIAADNLRHLSPMADIFEQLANHDSVTNTQIEGFINSGLFQILFNCLYLMWTHSKYFNTPTRLVNLLKEIANDLIATCIQSVGVSELFGMEVEEAKHRIGTALAFCGQFKNCYFAYKAKAAKETSSPWRFPNNALFIRLDAFLERCHDWYDVLETVELFARLEKVEIGGVRGSQLTDMVTTIYDAFFKEYIKFKHVDYNILSVEAKEFEDHLVTFRDTVRDLEKRLGAILSQAFDETNTIYAGFKVVDSFEYLLERDVIQQEWLKKQMDLIHMYHAELKVVQDIFHLLMHQPPIYANMPPTAGALVWCKGLMERIDDPMDKISQLNIHILESTEAKETIKLYHSLMRELKDYAKNRYETWSSKVGNISKQKLNQPILRQSGDKLLRVNFDPELVRLLREVNYIDVLNQYENQEQLGIPSQAVALHNQSEMFRAQTSQLQLIVSTYNNVVQTLLDVERSLIEQDLDAVNNGLYDGLSEITWNMEPRINRFIKHCLASVTALDTVLGRLKSNVESIVGSLQQFMDSDDLFPVDSRVDKTMTLDQWTPKYAAYRNARTEDLSDRATNIHNTIQTSFDSLTDISKSSSAWTDYVAYVGKLLRQGLIKATVRSLTNLRNQVDSEWLKLNDGIPALDIKLMLIACGKRGIYKSTFDPPLSVQEDQDNCLELVVKKWTSEACEIAGLVPQLEASRDDYLWYIHQSIEVQNMIHQIETLTNSSYEQCREFQKSLEGFSYLWTQDMVKTFEKFLQPHVTDDDSVEPESSPPSDSDDLFFGRNLSLFEDNIEHYEDMKRQVMDLPDSVYKGWLKLDAKPLKQSLKSICEAWKACFTDHLYRKVESSLKELFEFMEMINVGLERKVVPGDMSNLMTVLGHIRDCKNRNAGIRAMFRPIHEALDLLKRHGRAEDVATIETLKVEAPDRWGATNKRSLFVREALSDLQDQEAQKVKDTTQQFEEDVVAFREKFFKMPAFRYANGLEKAYVDLDEWDGHVGEIEQSGKNLTYLQELFDLNPSQFKNLKDCRTELMHLKQLWDMISHVDHQFQDWMTTAFKNVDIDFLLDETKKLLKQLKQFPSMIKKWDAFVGIEQKIRNMAVSLPLIQDLRSSSMRDRHWRALLKSANTTSEIDPMADTFTLEQLMKLDLHSYVDEVATIVEKASKELLIEKNLIRIRNTWTKLELTYTYDEGLRSYLIGSAEHIIEVLEEDSIQLQSMQGNRFVEYFIDQVNKWQRALGQVDMILILWMGVQKQWQNLFSIFILSEDIRQQLPEDANNFKSIDDTFRILMDSARYHTNVIEACITNVISEGIKNRIDWDSTPSSFESVLLHMQQVLQRCEKSLADYLETKRLAFPRFYFVSSVDLLDILSKGSIPKAVMIHLSKIIDSLETLTFADAKKAFQMVSRENEVIDFVETFDCSGPVEVWLNGCIEMMRQTMRSIMHEAHAMYVEQPRAVWLKQYCAQVVVANSRIWFTAETVQAFDRLDDGNEMAMKDYRRQQKQMVGNLISMVLGDLDQGERTKIITLITIDIHSRDVIEKLVEEKVASAESFQWQSQLRYWWDDKRGCGIDVCDAQFIHGLEYIGNCGCLVITPLTDRCYITLTQSLRLCMGGAPAGPAGTGKTETTKDLARALGYACYVFNCSDQQDYKSLGNIFKGLAMSGSWGCFDEFNRISIEVLSVVATQVKSILDAIRYKKKRFRFGRHEIPIIPTVGIFITMNPGYKGRTELPENIKALFRPCAMIVPDLQNIAEIMLSAEGFLESKDLAKKFVTLYSLNNELLSKKAHYDWGLRAVKSVLVIAGPLKRAEPDVEENKILMRALRDTNLAKLSKDDVDIFKKLIQALFPGVEIAAKTDKTLEKHVVDAVNQNKLQVCENEIFVLKCVQFKELLDVRHSVFLLGPAGAGKTCCWKTLSIALGTMAERVTVEIINPKAITSNELYGYMHEISREWRDGILARIFRELSLASKIKSNPKWIVLDGDMDSEWIESMNTVMDDNKMLTLASNERITLAASMKLVFEISHLRNATPATVSRAGIIFINQSDVGYAAFKDTWVSLLTDKVRHYAELLFEKYLPSIFEFFHRHIHPIIAIHDINLIQTLCYILNGLWNVGNPEEELPSADVYERVFVFACIWTFGGCLSWDGHIDYRSVFSHWWKKEFTTIKISDHGSVFDYCMNAKYEFVPWADGLPAYEHDHDAIREEGMGGVFVDTCDTVRTTFFLDLFFKSKRPFLLVGTAGTGKTTMIQNKLSDLDYLEMLHCSINFNSATESQTLQTVMEMRLDKKSGRQYGPPGRKSLVFFIDDLNMPEPDKYGTQSAIALLRQHFDYSFWYDRNKLTVKEIVSIQFLAAMNPKAGSFAVDDRFQRHFAIFSCSPPDTTDLRCIVLSILDGHFADPSFSQDVRGISERLTQALISLHSGVRKAFRPTAIKFYYQFNLRHMARIVQGLVRSDGSYDPPQLVRLWKYECERTFADGMDSADDVIRYHALVADVMRLQFGDMNLASMNTLEDAEAMFFVPTHVADDEEVYNEMSAKDLAAEYTKYLAEYNQEHPAMHLVLFDRALEHVCRIGRILSTPRGNALLVGVGGSGKQSLARLASYICGLEGYQIQVTSAYGKTEFRNELQQLYHKTAIRNNEISFIITDSQIPDPRMLQDLNDLLSSGFIPDLFTTEERDGICHGIINEVRASGHPNYGSPDVCWDFFVNKVRNNLHVCLCFSPVGAQFREWCRKFPTFVTCTSIDWFHPWPEEALVSVALNFLSEESDADQDYVQSIAKHMAFVHSAANEISSTALPSDRSFTYTPKSFLELISLYKSLLKQKRQEIEDTTSRLLTGIQRLSEASAQVKDLQESLQREQVIVAEKAENTDKLLEHVGKERVIVEEQNALAEAEEVRSNEIVNEVAIRERECMEDLDKVQPIIASAVQALNTLNKNNLRELKSMTTPPPDVAMVTGAVMVLMAPQGKIPKDRSWNQAKKMMTNIAQWLKDMENFDRDNIIQANVDILLPIVNNPAFQPAQIEKKSFAASSLCKWVVAMVKYHEVRCDVRPKEQRLAEAQEMLAAQRSVLKKIQDKVSELKGKLDSLVRQFEAARDEKLAIEDGAANTQLKLTLAERLTRGLADENVRWVESIKTLKTKSSCLVGDVLLASAFVSYIGHFPRNLRHELYEKYWLSDIKAKSIPLSAELDPVLDILTNEAEIASWCNEGLPADRVSIENGSIVQTCHRWPLMIDPQLQALKWIKRREGDNGLRIIQQSGPNYLNTLLDCVEEGVPCMITNLDEYIEPVLDPILSRTLVKKGTSSFLKIGDKEVRYNKKFRLYLQTKLSNPHYRPEVHAQTTIVNFMVTEDGLEEQLLAQVVKLERPEWEEARVMLLRDMNQMKIDLKKCEDELLTELSNARGDILENKTLVMNLESTKRNAENINISMAAAIETNTKINASRQFYRPVAERASLLFFQIDQLAQIDHMYQYSLEAFDIVFQKALDKAQTSNSPEERLGFLLESITEVLFAFTSRGLFEKHKLIFATTICFSILSKRGQVDPMQLNFLLRGPKKHGIERPESVLEWLPESNWAAIQALSEVEGGTPSFDTLPSDIVDGKRWRDWCNLEKPEEDRLPMEWKSVTPFQKLLILRCLRPDRLTAALGLFIAHQLGPKYIKDQSIDLPSAFADSSLTTPLFFILSPGVNPLKDVELLGFRMGFTEENGNFHYVSLGQGQEPIAEQALETCFKEGGWVFLSNINLTKRWLPKLEKMLDKYAEEYNLEQMSKGKIFEEEAKAQAKVDLESRLDFEKAEESGSEAEKDGPASPRSPKSPEEPLPALKEGDSTARKQSMEIKIYSHGHPDCRVFLSAEPSENIPQGILQRSIKLTNEPPQGLQANMVRAWNCFSDETWGGTIKQTEFKAILFSLCYFHAVVVERKKFGPQGWNRNYPFNLGDLATCVLVLHNYLEDRPKNPWEDLRYAFGEIIYGGHITDDWDRNLCSTYLEHFIRPEVLQTMELCPGFHVPSGLSHAQYLDYIETEAPPESPILYGLHPNAEINFRTIQADALLRTITELRPRQGTAGMGVVGHQDVVRQVLDEILNNLPMPFHLSEMAERLEDDRGPFQNVFSQECERMNILIGELQRSLTELDLGLKGALSMSTAMQQLADHLFLDQIPDTWTPVAFLSSRPLGSWFQNLQERYNQLGDWSVEFAIPKCVWISGFFNPMAFLTAIKQTIAMAFSYDLDTMTLVTEVLKKSPDQMESAAREGSFIHGLYMEGARWDAHGGSVEDIRMKELYHPMPVMLIKALPLSKTDSRDLFACPVYRTQERGPGYVCTFHLKTKHPARKWVIGGVALLMDVVEL